MSIRLMSAAWEIPLADSDKLVLLALADWSDDRGNCWPSIAQLAEKCTKGERTVQASIQRLVEAGHLTRNEIVGKGCKYIVHPRSECTPAAAAPREDGTPAEPAHTPAAAAPNTSLKPQLPSGAKAPSGKRKRAKVIFELPDWVPEQAWAAFAQMRKAMHRVPFTDDAKKGIVDNLEKLKAMGHDPAECLLSSVINGYRGVFPPKDIGNDNPKAAKPLSDIGRQRAASFTKLQAGEITDAEFERERTRLDRLEADQRRERISA